MKALQAFALFTLPIFFVFSQHHVYEGLNIRSWCFKSGYIVRSDPQSCSSLGNGLHHQGFLGDFVARSPVMEVNITFSEEPLISDHQNIVILEEDPVVVESAFFLFEKHPSTSTLLNYHNGTLHVIKGPAATLMKKSRVVLVGHGSKGNDGVVKFGGYIAEDISTIVGAVVKFGGHIHTLSLVGCYLGSDLQFAKKLLTELRGLNVETRLHLWRSELSVSPAGEKLTRDEDVWRFGDSGKKVIAWLDERGNLMSRVDYMTRGDIVPNYKGRSLYFHTLEWPTHPQMFVPADLRKKYTAIDCLEGLTWSLFFEEHEKRRAPDFIPTNDFSPVWLGNHQPDEVASMKHITNILDLVLEIRHHAKEDENSDLYYVLNSFIFKVQKRTFFTSLEGKYMNPNNQQEMKMFLDGFEAQKDRYTIAELRQGLKAHEFNEFCRQTFLAKHCERDCGLWSRYFMEAVFSASIRNFRTFSLFLMSVIACEVSRSRGVDDSICSAFVGDEYPMVREDPWPFHGRRGFYGCTLDSNEKQTKHERIYWLDEVVSKENSLYSRSKLMMSGVDHDQNTELDIFGRVKVMNKYAFASYLEYFRGTIEGKKISRGCIAPSTYDPYE